MSNFQRRHYEALAFCIGNNRGCYKEELLSSVVRMFSKDNPNFDEGRFRARIQEIEEEQG